MYLIFDTETTGLPRSWKAPITDVENWPRCVQIAWQLYDEMGVLIEQKDFLIRPDGFDVPYEVEKIHGISTALALQKGHDIAEVIAEFKSAIEKTSFLVGQNVGFDVNVWGCEFHRFEEDLEWTKFKVLDTCTEKTAELCQLPGGRGGKFKLPNLTELHQYLFQESFGEAHNATADVEATSRCFLELLRKEHYSLIELQQSGSYFADFQTANPSAIQPLGLKHLNLKEESAKLVQIEAKEPQINTHADVDLSTSSFAHLHNHTQFSVLESTTKIQSMIDRAVEFNMPAVAITDYANLYGAFHFVDAIHKHPSNKEILEYNKAVDNGDEGGPKKDLAIKGIVGCELSVCRNHADKDNKDNGKAMVFLAKTKEGYHNLSKMSSLAFTDGFYYVPRIDKEIVKTYKKDLIVLSGGLNGEIADLILSVGEKQAEESIAWWKNQFGDDFYIELVRHGIEEDKRLNDTLIRLAKKHNVKLVAANNSHYLNKEDANAHDILLCVKDAELQSTPIGRGRGFRYGFPNDEYYFKSQEEMKTLFKDIPEAISNITEVISKVESYQLKRDVLLPAFDIPKEFIVKEDEEDGGKRGENAYLRHLSYEGAKERYPEITDEIKDRLDFELETIAKTGYPGYFLIVQDFTRQARKMGVSVGPGRGSAAGSAVAYCVGITNVDPIKYDLLFERFLNPDRVSLPDIDIDFDDEGRNKIIDWVVNKYGQNQVAQIITYGTMAAKSSLRDTARVLDLPLSEANGLTKKMPDIKLNKLFNFDDNELKEKLNGEQFKMAQEFKQIADGDDLQSKTIKQATILEGSLRNIGLHACGVIITPDDISKFIPVRKAKDTELLVTQFDNSVVESAGMLKMDFLGLKNLTIIKDCCKIIKHIHNKEIDPDNIPLDDELTYQLFQRGETNGIFQFESPGMQKNLKALKPDKFDDLIAMNALYRPGPMEYIPNFIARKHGKEDIIYDLPEMSEILSDTYGITVYQEQVMLLSQELAGFSKGDADVLRKAMGKKIFALLEKLKPKFLEGCNERGHDVEIAEKIWGDWEAFAAYAFNKSHSTCYALIAFQTAYLKAHYPAEYMAAYLTHNMNDIKKVTFYMEECKRMGIKVLGPDVNESFYKFAVNKKGEIRFGLGAVKGVGEGAVETIVNERQENGNYQSIFDLSKRIDLRAANKRAFESLVYAGGFDSFGHKRSTYFYDDGTGSIFLERVMKYGHKFQENLDSAQVSLFGESSEDVLLEPKVPDVEPWSTLEMLNKEKEVVGFYISGHPLDDYRLEMESFCNFNISEIKDFTSVKGRDIQIAGMVAQVEHRFTKGGKPFGTISLEDYHDQITFFLFGDDYPKFKAYMTEGWFVHAQCRVQERKWSKDNELEIKLISLELLSEIKEKAIRSVNVSIELEDLSSDIINSIQALAEDNVGKHNLKIIVNDSSEGYAVSLRSKKFKINLNEDFIMGLKQIPMLEIQVN
ncbi:DNA polymerase III subunit alpha [Flavobacteriales bacterium]|nr:DNA polymerase III subunit alpha [Flavobacteriales bacterium]